MIDSKTATDRLREMLDERDVEWWEGWNKSLTVFDGANDVRYMADCMLGQLYIRSVLPITPEQAVAATLGSDRENELQAALNKAAGNWAKADRLARDIWEQVSHCPDYPIPPCMTESICEQFRNLPDVEQAATLGSGECEMVTSGTPCEGNADKACIRCGAYGIGEFYDGDGHISTPRFCPNCGRKVM